MDEYISIKDLEKLSGKSGTLIRNMCKSGKLDYKQEKFNKKNFRIMINKNHPEVKKLIHTSLEASINDLNYSPGIIHPEEKIKSLEDLLNKKELEIKNWQYRYFKLQDETLALIKRVADFCLEDNK